MIVSVASAEAQHLSVGVYQIVMAPNLNLERLLQAPNNSPAVPCESGEYALYTQATYSLQTHNVARKVLRLEVATGEVTEVSTKDNDINFKWIHPSTNLIWQRNQNGKSELWVEDKGAKYSLGLMPTDLKLVQACVLENDDLGILFSSTDIVSDSSEAFSTGKVFDQCPNLTFDQGVGRTQGKLFFLTATRGKATRSEKTAKYALDQPPAFVDILKDHGLEWFPYSGAMPNISPPNCAISKSGVAFAATREGESRLGRFSSEFYFMPMVLSELTGPCLASPVSIQTEGRTGWSGPPSFSADGSALTFWRDRSDEKPFVHRSIHVIRNVRDNLRSEELALVEKNERFSSLLPESLLWSRDKTSIYFTAIELGCQKLFKADLGYGFRGVVPAQVAPRPGERGSIVASYLISEKDIALVTTSSFNSFNSFSTLNLVDDTRNTIPGQADPHFSDVQVLEAWFESEGRQIRTNIIRPSNFDETKKHPTALFVHGGPFSTFADAYTSRWCMALFAEQGYIVLTPDFTGSVGYSSEFRDAVWGEMGGKPYRDLEACMDFAARELPYSDVERAVCLGGSFGGHMALWITGQPLAKRFKAIDSHAAPMFGAASIYSTDVPDLWQKLAGGDSEDTGNPAAIPDRWDPSRYADTWATPLLLTHGARDNRCSVSVSIAAFTHCQFKGVESRLLVFPDESHFIMKPQNLYHWYKEVIAWMDKYTKN